jgi:F-type H+-transporting ATPase subunit alpha
VIYAGTKGLLDDVARDDIRRFESELLEVMKARHADILTSIRETGALADDGPLRAAIEEFKTSFSPGETVEESGPSNAAAIANAAGEPSPGDDEQG